MNEGSISAIIEPLIALVLVGVGVAWYKQMAVTPGGYHGRSRGRRVAANPTPSRSMVEASRQNGGLRPRQVVVVAQNVAGHPYDELVLSDLHDHLFEGHFEVWNLVASSGSPARWRREHAADHGLVLK